LRGLYRPGPDSADRKPLIVAVGGFDSILEELYQVFGKAGLSVVTGVGPGGCPGLIEEPRFRVAI
jgi:hypothetical protein